MFTLLAPAKINLTLEVLGRRPDGFHEVRSVMQTLSFGDNLRFRSGREVEFLCYSPDWHPEKSLVSRAVALMQKATGCSKGAIIEVDKRIPLMSGLGGDSSDAAAILRGLNKLWGLGLPHKQLVELAAQLGSDVTFFLYGGTALAEGRGEIVVPLPPLPHKWVILMVPPEPRLPGKTEKLYGRIKPNHYTDGRITGRLVEALRQGGEFTPSFLFNTFENIVFTPLSKMSPISVYRGHALKVGAGDIHLAGSGPALYTLLEDRDEAEDLCSRLEHQRMEPYLTETLAAVSSGNIQ
jgi:4-diphosphocytidyl-2-C-methyl-D-erythritol kinase